jgi:hypothetical protein
MRRALSRNGVRIRLTDERWEHIVERHPILEGRLDDVMEALGDPDLILRGSADEFLAVCKDDDLYLVVVYRETSPIDGFIITSYLTNQPVDRPILWKR